MDNKFSKYKIIEVWLQIYSGEIQSTLKKNNSTYLKGKIKKLFGKINSLLNFFVFSKFERTIFKCIFTYYIVTILLL